MAANPVVRMTAASVVCGIVVWLVAGSDRVGDVVLGMVGPLAAAVGTWIVVERTHARAPERVSGVMVKLFGAKLVLFAAYLAAVVILLSAGHPAFVVSFTCQYVLLHAMEALYLRRLFAGDALHRGLG